MEELANDYETKYQATMEREKQLLQNETNLIKLKEQLDLCKLSTASIEWQLENDEQKLHKLEENFKQIQASSRECINCLCCKSNKYAIRGREQLFELLVKMDETNNCLIEMHKEFVDYEKYAQKPPHSAYNDISAILDLHVRILVQAEQRIDCLFCQAQAIHAMFNELKAKMMTNHTTV